MSEEDGVLGSKSMQALREAVRSDKREIVKISSSLRADEITRLDKTLEAFDASRAETTSRAETIRAMIRYVLDGHEQYFVAWLTDQIGTPIDEVGWQ